jgi:hypothetical protein
MSITATSWLALATVALALISSISIIISMHENKKNHKLTILMKRAEGFYSKLFFILQSVGYDNNNKNNLQPMVLNLCASSSMLLGNSTKNAMDRFIREVDKVPREFPKTSTENLFHDLMINIHEPLPHWIIRTIQGN